MGSVQRLPSSALETSLSELEERGRKFESYVEGLLAHAPDVPEFYDERDSHAFGWVVLRRLRRMQEEMLSRTPDGGLVGMFLLAEWPLRHLEPLSEDAAVQYVLGTYVRPVHEQLLAQLQHSAAPAAAPEATQRRKRPDQAQRFASLRERALGAALAVVTARPDECKGKGGNWAAERIATAITNWSEAIVGDDDLPSHDQMTRYISEWLNRIRPT